MIDVDVSYLISAIITFMLGFVVGYRLCQYHTKTAPPKNAMLTTLVISVWVLSVLYDANSAAYETPYMVHIIAGIVVGSIYDVDFFKFFKK